VSKSVLQFPKLKIAADVQSASIKRAV